MTRSVPYAYLGEGVGLVQTSLGHRMYVDTRDTIAAPHLIIDGFWESWVTEFITKTFVKGGHFIDVGAHLGWFTLLGLHLGAARVTAFEPNPRLAELLERTLTLNGAQRRAEVVRKAASDGAGTLSFEVPKHWSGNGRVAAKEQASGRESDWFSVEAVRLDDVAFDPAPAFIKVDAEGHEPRVLRGAAALLRSHPDVRLLVEHHEGTAHTTVMRWMTEELGFSLGVLNHHGFVDVCSVDDLSQVPDSEMIYLARD